jgi:peptide/nickel transport system permease protein
MWVYMVKRVFAAIATLFSVSLLIFVGSQVLPGDVAEVALGDAATPESVAQLRELLGLNHPPVERYIAWLSGMLHGDWGLSIMTRVPVADLMSERLRNTAVLAGLTAAVAVPIAVGLGVSMALRPGNVFDRAMSVAILSVSAVPEFLVGTCLVLIFSVRLRWLPAVFVGSGQSFTEFARSMTLPVATLTLVTLGNIARMTRASLVNIQGAPFIEMARLKGLSRTRTILLHAVVNVAGPILNIIALNLAYLVSGIVVVETIFSYPGLARLMVDAVVARDLPVVQACAMVFCLTYVLLIFAADILSMVVNPRLIPRR